MFPDTRCPPAFRDQLRTFNVRAYPDPTVGRQAWSGCTQHIFASPGLGPVAGAPFERGLAIRRWPVGPNSSEVLARAPYRDDAKGDGQTIHEGIPEEAFPWMVAMHAARLIAERAAEQTSGECVCSVRSQHERGNKNELLERFHFVSLNVGREWTATAHSVVMNGRSASRRCGSNRRTC